MVVALAATGIVVSSSLASPESKSPPRKVAVSGTGQDAMRFASTARRRGTQRWCLELAVHRRDDEQEGEVTAGWEGEGYCGTIRQEGAVSLAFACPYGVGASGVARGRPEQIEYVAGNGQRFPARIKRLRDRSGAGTLWATAVATNQLPGRIVASSAGSDRTITELETLQGIC